MASRDSWVQLLNQIKEADLQIMQETMSLDALPCGDVAGALPALQFWLTRPREPTAVTNETALDYGTCVVELAGACEAAGQTTPELVELLNEAVRVLYVAANHVKTMADSQAPVITAGTLMSGRQLAAVSYQIAVMARRLDLLRLETQGLHLRSGGVLSVDGHRRELVGPAMVELADAFQREGWPDQAIIYYEAVCADFNDFVKDIIFPGDGTAESDRIIMESLLTTYDSLVDLVPDTDKVDGDIYIELLTRIPRK